MDYICLTVDGRPRMSWLTVPVRTTVTGRMFTVPTIKGAVFTAVADIVRRTLDDTPFDHLGLAPEGDFRLDASNPRVLGKLKDLNDWLTMKAFLCFDATRGFPDIPFTVTAGLGFDPHDPALAVNRLNCTLTSLTNWDGLPLALSNAGNPRPPIVAVKAGTGSEAVMGPPSPGYWPVLDVFLNESQAGLHQTLVNDKLDVKACEGAGLGTFLRDAFINIGRETSNAIVQETWSTTRAGANIQKVNGFADTGPVVIDQHLPQSAMASGFGFGGNFLTVERDGAIPCLFYGRSDQQVGGSADDHSMIDTIVRQQKHPVETVGIETGWLKVGHVDEIMSFPGPGHAILASPALYLTTINQKTPIKLDDQTLNAHIDAFLLEVEGVMTKQLGLKVHKLPVWFKLCDGDPMHVTSVRGNAVNCVYDSASGRSIHARSGPSGTGVIDDVVTEVMRQLNYAAVFVDMSSANDEGGGGGNVHCATYTRHIEPK